eukprot:12072355-Alexandrium_andersonii.AAC.1
MEEEEAEPAGEEGEDFEARVVAGVYEMTDEWERGPCVTCGRIVMSVPVGLPIPEAEWRCQMCHALHVLTEEVSLTGGTLTSSSIEIVAAHLAAINTTVQKLPREAPARDEALEGE